MTSQPSRAAAAAPCCVDVNPWPLAVLRVPKGVGATSLLSAALETAPEAAPLAAFSDGAGGISIIVPRSTASALPDNRHGDKEYWIALALPSKSPIAYVFELLTAASVETLAIAALDGRPCILVRRAALATAIITLADAGFGIGPVTQPCYAASDVCKSAGVWAWCNSGEQLNGDTTLPYALRFQASSGIFVDIRIPTCTDSTSPCAIESSRAGRFLFSEDGLVQKYVVGLRPWILGECEELKIGGTWTHLQEQGITAVLELACSSGLQGFWLFSEDFFARVIGPAPGVGMVSKFCWRDAAQIRHVCGSEAVDAELLSQFEAVLGRVEKPGRLRVLRCSWSTEPEGIMFYDAYAREGGHVEIDTDLDLVVHQLPSGMEQRWRILSMTKDPFTPTGRSNTRNRVEVFGQEEVRSTSPNAGDGDCHAEKTDNSKHVKTVKDKANEHESSRSPSLILFDKDDQDAKKDEAKHSKKTRDESSGSRGKDKKKDKKKRTASRSKSCSARKKSRSRSKKKGKDRDRNRDRDRDRDKDRKRRDDMSRSRSASEKKRRKNRSRSKRKSRSRSKRKGKSKSRSRSKERVKARKPGGGFDQREPEKPSPLAQTQALLARGIDPALLSSLTTCFSNELSTLPYTHLSPQVEAFLFQNPVEGHAASRLRSLPAHVQRAVMERGSLHGARDPSAVLISRVRDAIGGSTSSQSVGPAMPAPSVNGSLPHPGVEMLIARFNLDARCAQLLRALPHDKQIMAAELPVHEARNPSAFVMAQLQLPHFARHSSGSGSVQSFQAL